jgi:hypothetical protein
MLQIIKDKLSIIYALVFGTGGGWCMTSIITAPELKQRLITMSVAISLILSIIISVSLKNKLRTIKNYRSQIMRKLYLLLFGFLLSVAIFFIVYDKYTIAIPEINSQGTVDTIIIVKGLYHTRSAETYADKLLAKDNSYPDDHLLLNDYAYQVNKIWDDNSLSYARLLLLFLYSGMIAFFIGAITYGTEIFQNDAGKTTD